MPSKDSQKFSFATVAPIRDCAQFSKDRVGMKGLNPSLSCLEQQDQIARLAHLQLCALGPMLWASTETMHFRAMIRALLWGRYCAIVAEFQYNGLAEDLTLYSDRVHTTAPTTTPSTNTHPLIGYHCQWMQSFLCVCKSVTHSGGK